MCLFALADLCSLLVAANGYLILSVSTSPYGWNFFYSSRALGTIRIYILLWHPQDVQLEVEHQQARLWACLRYSIIDIFEQNWAANYLNLGTFFLNSSVISIAVARLCNSPGKGVPVVTIVSPVIFTSGFRLWKQYYLLYLRLDYKMKLTAGFAWTEKKSQLLNKESLNKVVIPI